VAAFLGTSTPADAGRLADRGFDVIEFEGPDSTWSAPLDRLAKALGR
jgi:hypothetical protein